MMRANKRITTCAFLIAILTLGGAVVVFSKLPKPLTVSDLSFQLAQIEDGAYLGSCDNGLVRADVKVAVQNHAITEVRLLRHDNGRGAAAEAIAEKVVRFQSVEIDAVSGATASSQTILKAIENALSKRSRYK